MILYKVTYIEYKEKIETIMTLFNKDVLYGCIDFGYILEESY
ncbi:hypothetical protein [Romboutsia ilealis]|nr:hypothetical protein [Romboutsia ilealis]